MSIIDDMDELEHQHRMGHYEEETSERLANIADALGNDAVGSLTRKEQEYLLKKVREYRLALYTIRDTIQQPNFTKWQIEHIRDGLKRDVEKGDIKVVIPQPCVP